MKVTVNNTICELDEASTVLKALEQSNITSHKGIAVAVNNSVIPKAEWENKILQENDKITVIKATQGG